MAIVIDKRIQGLRSCILLLGPNGGTRSILFQILTALGCEAPASLGGEKPGEVSPRICAFNEELLASAGSSAEDFTSFHSPWLESPYAPEFLDRAVGLLGEEFGNAPLFVLSDPSISRLVPFWIEALDRFGCTTRAVIVVSDEEASGQADHNVPLAEMIGLRQMLDSERDTRGIARIFVTGDQLVQQWSGVAEKAQKAFQLIWPKAIDSAEFEVADVLQELRGKAAPRDGRRTLGNVWLDHTSKILSDWAQDEESADDQASLDAIRSEFDVASNAFARVARAADRPRQPGFSRSRPNSLRPTQRQQTANGSEELEAVKATLMEQRRNATLLNAEIEQQIEAREAVEAQLIEAQAEIAASRSRRKEMARVIGNREAKIARLNEELAARYEELAKLQRLMVRSNPLWAAKAAVRRINRSVRRAS